MLTSVENSPTTDFYPKSLRFSDASRAIISKGSDQICVNETAEWDDLEHLMGTSSIYKAPNPTRYSVTYNRRIFPNENSISHDNSKLQDTNLLVNDHSQGSEFSLLPFNFDQHCKIINNLWNTSNNESNYCSKTCVNVNMGFNEGSSLESMVSNNNTMPQVDVQISANVTEKILSNPTESTDYEGTITNVNQSNSTPVPVIVKDDDRDKTFKNSTKTGHSRQWGSCGSARMLQFNFDEKKIKSKLSLELRPLNVSVTVSPSTVTTLSPLPTIGIRNTPVNQTDRQKRISQQSFEAEFDSEGRIHEQVTITFTEYDPSIIASQITLIELTYFRAIKSEEFLSFNWTGLMKHTYAPGIVASTRWFNQLNFWAQRVILDCTELIKRSEMLTYFIRIIKKLVDSFNNLSSGMALMSALEVECIHRLKQTWNNLQNKDRVTFRRMQELFSSASNYEKLREHINSLKLPCIPYLGLYLTDLVYINVAHSKLSEFESQTKTDQINNILRTVSEFQQSEYVIEQIPILFRYLETQRYIEELQKIIEDNNYKSSLLLEPNISDTSNILSSNQPQDFQNITTSPKSPPSYACKHLTSVFSMQSPISPKQMVFKSSEDSIKNSSELQSHDTQLEAQNSGDISIGEDYGANRFQKTVNSDCLLGSDSFEDDKTQGFDDSLMNSSHYSDEVKVSLLCGASRKSQFQKRTSIRLKRDSSSSSRQQMSSKTGTLSSTNQSTVSDKDIVGQHSKSLLDDSYIDAAVIDTCSRVSVESTGQISPICATRVVSRKPFLEVIFTPPIFRCTLGKDEVKLVPQSRVQPSISSSINTDNPVFQNIAYGAEQAMKLSTNNTCYLPSDLNDIHKVEPDKCLTEKYLLKLICQGILSRKSCVKDAKRSRFAIWTRYWAVLIKSNDNAYLVLYESSHFRTVERKDFKSKQCVIQDLKKVIVSCTGPTKNKKISEKKPNYPHDNSSACSYRHSHQNLKKFFLIDTIYNTVYKFRDTTTQCRVPSKHRKSVTTTSSLSAPITKEEEQSSPVSPSWHTHEMPSTLTWYNLLRKSIKDINFPTNDNKDLIVLNDN